MAKAKKKPTKAAKKPAKAAKKPKAKAAAKATPKKAAPKAAPKAAKKAAPKKAAAKPAKAKPAKAAKPAAKPAGSPAPTSEQLAKVAMGGDLKVLGGLVSGTPDRDLVAYKWLAVASDHGHADADELLAELRDSGALDDEARAGQVHFELALAYLTGSDGLPIDHDKARSQLASAKERDYPGASDSAPSILQRARGRLEADALAVFDAVYDGAAPEGTVDSAWGNEHTHNDPEPGAHAHVHHDDHDVE